MRTHFQDLRTIGRQLEESGVLSDALRSRSNSWGLHMPLVCPDGAVVAYAWKRQLAGQAGASAVDRTRLALKSFTDQKRRFFPHLDAEPSLKRHCGLLAPTVDNQEESTECRNLEDVVSCLEKEVPDIKISTFGRLAWLKRASLLPSSANDDSMETSIGHSYRSANSLRPGALGDTIVDKAAVIELFLPSIFRAIVSLHPVGSTSPDAIAFFSPDEGGSYLHPRGLSVYHVFRHITEYANMALQHFRGVEMDGCLLSFLQWLASYQTLFSRPCSKCGRLLSMDRQLAILLPPVHRSYRQFSASRISTKTKEQRSDLIQAYHIGCSPPDL